jgi:sulfoxide reductase heme-binding subunit YedZ
LQLGGALPRMVVVALGLAPFGWLVWAYVDDALGAEPVETLTHVTGEWALRLLILTLAVSPLRRHFGWGWLQPHRRTFGLLAFFYASLHLAVFVVLETELDPGLLVEEVVEHPYVTAGLTSFLAMLPLAITSTRGWIRHLGKRWLKLHRLVYLAAVAAVVHFVWLVKADLLEPLFYAGATAFLLGLRLYGGRPRRA